MDSRYRSRTNVVFRVRSNESLEKKFVAQAHKQGLIELKGHRLVGGCRASLYNAMPVEGVKELIRFMEGFRRQINDS